MDKGLYVAMTGASATLQAQAAVAHNLANVDTVGFKAALAATAAAPIPGAGWASRVNAVSTGNGVDTSAGSMITTGGELDIALHGERWLAVQDAAGGEAYTRAGNLQLTANGLLTTASGELVLDEGGAPISIPPYQSITIAGDGTVSVIPQGEGAATTAIVGRLRVVDAAPGTIARGGDGLMHALDPINPLPQAAGNVLTSGVVEGSNVDSAGMLVSMIQLSRQFEMQVKVLKAGDENARSANTLLRMG